MKLRLMLFVAIAVLVTAAPLFGRESVCDLFSHLEDSDGREVVVTGDLIISKDLAVLGAVDCDNQYISRRDQWPTYQWPTALSLRPSPSVTPAQLQQFQNAGVQADRLRQEGKTVSASASFSGRIRIAPSGDSPAELTFDSFDNLRIDALPEASTLTVVPICDLFQNLSAWKGKRIAVRGEFGSTMEGAWIVGRCKGAFVTEEYRWPVSLTYGVPAYYSQETARLYEPKLPSPDKGGTLQGTGDFMTTATFVGLLRMRSEYEVFCLPNGRYLGNGFGHLNYAAGELVVESVQDVAMTERPDTDNAANDTAAQRCTPLDTATLCSKAESLARAASLGCTDRIREFLTKDGIDSKNGSESMSLRAAIRSGSESAVKLLLNAGAPVEPVEAARSPLAEAAFARQMGIVKLLLAAGAKLDRTDHRGGTFLTDLGLLDPGVVEILLAAGANADAADANGETALMKASSDGFAVQTIKVLIEHHAGLNLRDNKGRTAVMHAAASCCSGTLPLLLENGADPNARDNDGKTALDLAEASHNFGAIAVLSYAIKRSH